LNTMNTSTPPTPPPGPASASYPDGTLPTVARWSGPMQPSPQGCRSSCREEPGCTGSWCREKNLVEETSTILTTLSAARPPLRKMTMIFCERAERASARQGVGVAEVDLHTNIKQKQQGAQAHHTHTPAHKKVSALCRLGHSRLFAAAACRLTMSPASGWSCEELGSRCRPLSERHDGGARLLRGQRAPGARRAT
jgi:hypothetical protein